VRRLLDTDVVIDAIRGRPPGARRRLQAMSPDDVAVCAITVAELWYGAEGSQAPESTRALFEQFLQPFEVLPFDRPAAEHHGRLRHRLRQKPIGDRDLLIATIALANRLTIATRNVREFRRVPGLKIEDWST
jgi:tRNA(fMet)-specific endonuclease VapC